MVSTRAGHLPKELSLLHADWYFIHIDKINGLSLKESGHYNSQSRTFNWETLIRKLFLPKFSEK
jgi:hypothetical protein